MVTKYLSDTLNEKIHTLNYSDNCREHLGASLLGSECERAIWYEYRWYKDVRHDTRKLRIFETGNVYEDRIANELLAAGYKLHRNVKLQSQKVPALKGEADGIIEINAEKYILEIKTHNNKSFKVVQKGGDAIHHKKLKDNHPRHWQQIICYMGMSGIHKAIYLAVNKDNDELYEEHIPFDSYMYEVLLDKAKRICESDIPPHRISDDREFFLCKMCTYQDICHSTATNSEHRKSCRSCTNSAMLGDGTVKCKLTDNTLTKSQQIEACNKYETNTNTDRLSMYDL